MDKIGAELVEDTRVEESDSDAINSEVVAKQHIVAIFHNSESNLAHCVATVFQVTLEEIDFAEVEDWVFRRQHVEWYCCLRELENLEVAFGWRITYSKRKICLIVDLFGGERQVSDCSFIGCAERPITCLSYLFEILDLAGVFVLPVLGLLHSDRGRDDINQI